MISDVKQIPLNDSVTKDTLFIMNLTILWKYVIYRNFMLWKIFQPRKKKNSEHPQPSEVRNSPK
jgi:hypothetical protein